VSRRSYGTGSLTVRRDAKGRDTWYGLWRIGGRRIKRRLGVKRLPGTRDGLTRLQAERKLQQYIESDAVVVEGRRSVGQAGAQYVDHLENVMERKRTTVQDYRGYLRRHLEPFFGERALDRVDPAMVTSYLKSKRAAGLSAKTVQNHINFLNGLFEFSIRRGWASANPVARVDRPRRTRSPHRRIRFLQPEELDALMRAIPDDLLGAVERPLYLAAAMTGARQGEVLGLRWMDIDWVARRVRIAEPFTRGQFDSPKSHDSRSALLAGDISPHRVGW